MNIGLLWYDNSAVNLSVKIAIAAQCYRERFGEEPNVCYVKPNLLPDGECQMCGIRVLPSPRVPLHHLRLSH